MTNYGTATEHQIANIIAACERSGKTSIIALAGVPGTGKSFMASIVAQRLAGDPLMVREIQFHQSFSYEEFVEGMRIDDRGGVVVKEGIFLEWNQRASEDPDHRYVLLVEELTRANLSAVLGELMTYVEYRDRNFLTLYSRHPMKVARNLVILATYNPTDRSAIEVDSALLRRLRVIQCPPSNEQLAEMLNGKVSDAVIAKIRELFVACKNKFPDDYENVMPFGHGIFDGITNEQPDLNRLWEERVRHMLFPPLFQPHMLAATIKDNYPWRDAAYTVLNTANTTAPAEQAGVEEPATTAPAVPAEAPAAQ